VTAQLCSVSHRLGVSSLTFFVLSCFFNNNNRLSGQNHRFFPGNPLTVTVLYSKQSSRDWPGSGMERKHRHGDVMTRGQAFMRYGRVFLSDSACVGHVLSGWVSPSSLLYLGIYRERYGVQLSTSYSNTYCRHIFVSLFCQKDRVVRTEAAMFGFKLDHCHQLLPLLPVFHFP
jgi:hypothetical protein